jgi:hypothetical protein
MTTARAIHAPHHSYSGLDRAALHLGLALVTWSRRTRTHARDDEPRQYLLETHEVSAAQELATTMLYYRMR